MGEADEGPALSRRAAKQCGYLFVVAGLLALAGNVDPGAVFLVRLPERATHPIP